MNHTTVCDISIGVGTTTLEGILRIPRTCRHHPGCHPDRRAAHLATNSPVTSMPRVSTRNVSIAIGESTLRDPASSCLDA